MKIVHSPLHRRHQGGLELHRAQLLPSFECPERADYIRDALVDAGHALIEPRAYGIDLLHGVHDPGLVDFLRTAYARWQAEGRGGSMLPSGFPARGLRRDRVPAGIHGAMGYYAFDAGTPIVEGTWDAAFAAAQCALTAADLVGEGERAAYALCRPPGHHAARGSYGGYCYLNHAALAAQRLRDRGFGKVALVDVDYHHGNGSQDIFWERGDVLFASIHGTPDHDYPYFLGYADERGIGAGEGSTLNLPLPRGTDWSGYAAALDTVLQAVSDFGADALVVSLGVDTYEGDPISAFRLATAHFPMIGTRLAALGLSTVLVQEGGYAVQEIGTNVAGVLGAFG